MFDSNEKKKEYYRNYREKNLKKIRESAALYRKNNPEKIKAYALKFLENNPGKMKEYNVKYRKNHSDRKRESCRRYKESHPDSDKNYYRKNKDIILKKGKKYASEHPDIRKKCGNNYYRKISKTLRGRVDSRMSTAIKLSLKGNKSGRSWESLVGYTAEDLKKQLRKLFTTGMTWDKFMTGEIHIDHVVPKSHFKYTTAEDPQFRECWALHNLQPMWKKDNLSKGNRKYQLPLPFFNEEKKI